VPNEEAHHGTGTVAKGNREGTRELRYTPKGSRRLSKTVEAPWSTDGRKQAEDALANWRKGLDKQQNPRVKVPCSYLFELHLARMRRQQCDPENILDQENEHLIPFFGSREASTVSIADINAYVDKRLAKSAKPATINRELSNLRGAFHWL
jgi:hypothetical protein